jgi:hypothetical protein
MDCRKTKKLLGPFMDEELPEKERQKVADHLERCSACRHRLESLHKVEALSRQLVTVKPDETYWSTFLPRLRSRMARAQKRPTGQKIREAFGRLFAPPVPWVRIAGAVAAAVLVFILGRAVVHHEARMRRVRALPKKLLSEQARVRQERAPHEDVGQIESPGDLPQTAVESKLPPDEEVTGTTQEEPAKKMVRPGAISPPPPQDAFQTAGQASQTEEQSPEEKEKALPAPAQVDVQVPVSKGQELLAFDQAGEKDKGSRSVAAAGRVFGPDHWRRQIRVWQDSVKTQPISDRLEQFYFHLADSWYQLALLTESREDLLQAVEAQRAARDFAAEESIRELLRSRAQVLEERLSKK